MSEPTDWPPERIAECNADMAVGALAAIQELLDAGAIPRGTFADDQVRNLVALYNQRGAEIERLQAVEKKLRGVLDLRTKQDKRYAPCSDHSGKVNCGGEWECAWCRAERAETKAERLQGLYAEEYAAVDRVWKALGITTYEQAGGKEISQIVADIKARDQRRKQLLRECLRSTLSRTPLAARIRDALGDER